MNELQKQVTVNETGGDVLVDIRHIVDRGTLEAYQGVHPQGDKLKKHTADHRDGHRIAKM